MMCIAGLDGYFKRMNPAWTRVLGHSIEELLAEPFVNFVHPEDRAPTLAVVAHALKEDIRLLSFKNRYRCKDGSYRVLEWTAASSIERQVLCSVARDVTERDREQQRLTHLINSSGVVVYSLAVGPSGVIGCTFVSENVVQYLGFTAKEMIEGAEEWRASLDPADLPWVAERFAALLKEEQQSLRYRSRHKDGSYRWLYDERKLVRDASGAPVEIIGAWRDVTESVPRRRADQEPGERPDRALHAAHPHQRSRRRDAADWPDGLAALAQVLETLLEGVSARRAKVAILDITGVSVVDAHVADALLQAAKAVRLLGAEVVLTGIRPDVALTLVGLGLDLTGIVTKGTLQAGIVHAMQAQVAPLRG